MIDEYKLFFVNVDILDGKKPLKYLVRSDMGIPFSNGWQLLTDLDGEFEFVTIHTVQEVFPDILKYYDLSYGTKIEVVYGDGEMSLKIIN